MFIKRKYEQTKLLALWEKKNLYSQIFFFPSITEEKRPKRKPMKKKTNTHYTNGMHGTGDTHTHTQKGFPLDVNLIIG